MSITSWGAQDTWGYHTENSLQSIKHVSEEKFFKKFMVWVYIHNTANFAGYFLSPLIGVVRVVIAGLILIDFRDVPKKLKNKQIFEFMWMEIGRGVLEILCLGIFLSIVDAAFSYNRPLFSAETTTTIS